MNGLLFILLAGLYLFVSKRLMQPGTWINRVWNNINVDRHGFRKFDDDRAIALGWVIIFIVLFLFMGALVEVD